jgi:hypothetical protein
MLLDSVVRDPSSAYRWLDIGEALAQAGRIDQASYCIAKAVQLGGDSADVALNAGDFYLRYGDRRLGLHYLAKTLNATRAFDEPVFSLFAARGVTVDNALSYGVPAEHPPVLAYLHYLIDDRETAGAEKTWKWMVDRRLNDQQTDIDYCNFLFTQRQFGQAVTECAAKGDEASADRPGKQYLRNGDFAVDPFPGAVFDWRITPLNQVSIDRNCERQSEGCSLRIQFDGSTNVDFHNVSQVVLVGPGRFVFRASARTANVTTDQGLAFEIKDGENEGRLRVVSTQLRGTTDWQNIEIPFTVGTSTNFVEVSIVRHPSQRFDNRINGTAWIRNTSLVRVN